MSTCRRSVSRAEQLVADNRLYRQAATANGNVALAAVLDELERVLVDVAAGPETLAAADLVEVRQRIENKGRSCKVRVLSSEIRERQKTRNPRAGWPELVAVRNTQSAT